MMPASLRRLCAAFTLVLLASASAASAMDPGRASPVPAKQAQVAQVTARLLPWRVVELTGEARMRVPGAPFVALAVGDAVPIGNEVVTGRDSELRLERNKDRMTLSAASWVQLAPPQPGGLLDRFIQSIGTILYDVEPRRDRSFGVEAPYVAAVVKGTRFIVTTNVDLSSVHVEEGKVLVTARDGAGEAMVEPGETAVASPREAPGLILSSFDLPAGRPALAVGTGTADTAAPDGAGASANGAAAHAGGPLADAKGVLGPASDDGAPAAAAGASSGLGGTVAGAGGAVGGTAGALGDTLREVAA